MSIPLKEGFVNESLERCLEDLLVRFIVNCPEEDLSSIERVLFQIEEAHWFYQDFLRTLNPLLPSMKMKQFTNKLIDQCPLIWKWGDPNNALTLFGKYKSTIPVRGCCLLNNSLDKILLVKGIESSSWGFPRGKISKDESDLDCALRELEEETGFDASNLIDEEIFVERTIKGKNYKIYIIKNVPDNIKFIPKVRYEIVDIQWMDIKYLNKATKNTSNFYLVGAMLKQISSYIKRIKNNESDEKLKQLATIQLKKILGLDGYSIENDSNNSNTTTTTTNNNNIVNEVTDNTTNNDQINDPGRELLAILKSAIKPQNDSTDNLPTTSDSNVSSNDINNNINQQINNPILQQQQQMLYQQQYRTLNPSLPYHLLPPHSLQNRFTQQPPFPNNQHAHFPLQMFNPYFSPFANQLNINHLPHLQSNHNNNNNNIQPLPQLLQQNSLIAPNMTNSPSASTFAKPQFSMSHKKLNPENSKELLNILKLKPSSSPKDNNNNNINKSADLLNLLKNPTTSQSSSSLSPPSSSLSSSNTPIRILKREKPIENKLEPKIIKESIKESITKPIEKEIPLDITQPANSTTSSSIRSNISNGKPILLLKKSNINEFMNNQKTNENDNEKNEEPEQIEKEIESTEPNFKTLKPRTQDNISVDSLSFLTEPNDSKNNDPSAQLLNILKKPETPIHLQQSNNDSSSKLLNILKKPEFETELKSAPVSAPIDPSANLLNLLKKPTNGNDLSSPPPSSTSSQLLNIIKPPENKSIDPSSQLLNILKKPETPKVDPSAQLLNILKKPETTNTDPSANLLNILKKPETSNTDPSLQLLNMLKSPSINSPKSPESIVSDPSSQLLNILKKPEPIVQDTNQLQSQSLMNILTRPVEMNSPKIFNQLNNYQTNQTTKFNNFEDFEDFEDIEGNDSDIDGEYIINGGLYESDEE